jgi:DNA-binding NarL/FixJ family response regulator
MHLGISNTHCEAHAGRPGVTEFVPSDITVRWSSQYAIKMLEGWKVLLATANTYEAFLFSYICKRDGIADLIGSATTEQEALDLVMEAGTQKLLGLVSDSIATDCGSKIAKAIQDANPHSQCILIVNSPEKFYASTETKSPFSALTSSSRIGRGGINECVKAVFNANKIYIDPLLKQTIEELKHSGMARLNTRERDVLALVAEGASNKDIAQELFIAERTVRDYVSNILKKLGAPNRAGAAAWAIRHGIGKS